MKKYLLLTISLFLTLGLQAQVLQAEPRAERHQAASPSGIQMTATINPTSSQMWWGYFVGNESVSYLGTQQAETFDCAILIPANHELAGPSTIKAIRFHLNKATIISGASVWISKQLPSAASKADYYQSITVKNLSNGANDIQLKTPYEINNEAVYVGFTITIKRADYCIPVGGDYAENSLFLKTSNSVPQWQPLDGYGKLALQVLLDGGTYPQNIVTPHDFEPAVVELGKTVDVPVSITNGGKDNITSLSYTVTTAGVTTSEKTISTAGIMYQETASVAFPMESDAAPGTSERVITITRVNGNENTSPANSARGTLTTVATLKSWPRNVLIEEFTTEYCGYCPEAAAGLASFFSTYPNEASRVAVACHHAGFGTDWLTIDASNQYTWFYNDGGGTYAPAFMYNRYAFDGHTPVESRQGSAAGYKSRVESFLGEPAYVNIDLQAEFNAEGTAIDVTALCEQGWEFSSLPPRITLFLTEDNVKAHSQSGASGQFIHQHVLRAVNATWGEPIEWEEDNTAQYTYTFSLLPEWKKDDLKVVAFIAPYDSSNPTNCIVENCAVVTPAIQSAITTAATSASCPVLRYSIDGRRVSGNSRGLTILKMADGTTRKVNVER